MSEIKIHNMDCLEAMRNMKDKEFDIAIVDPPYGIGKLTRSNSRLHSKDKTNWNSQIPSDEYFDQLYRVSKNQIIWGANYYVGIRLPVGVIVHDKIGIDNVQLSNYSEADIAAHSFNRLVKVFRHVWKGNCQGGVVNWGNTGTDKRIHPCQKPVGLYKHLLRTYGKPGDKILETHLGSGSIAIACHDLGFDLCGYEIDEKYYKDALDRLEYHKSQMKLFNEGKNNC